jgi:hypothetical protein
VNIIFLICVSYYLSLLDTLSDIPSSETWKPAVLKRHNEAEGFKFNDRILVTVLCSFSLSSGH